MWYFYDFVLNFSRIKAFESAKSSYVFLLCLRANFLVSCGPTFCFFFFDVIKSTPKKERIQWTATFLPLLWKEIRISWYSEKAVQLCECASNTWSTIHLIVEGIVFFIFQIKGRSIPFKDLISSNAISCECGIFSLNAFHIIAKSFSEKVFV